MYKRQIATLRDLGVEIDDEGRGALPFVVHGAGRVKGGALEVDASSSSQFVSALLLVSARFDEGLDLQHGGDPLPSTPHINMTVNELRKRGVLVDDSRPDHWIVAPGPIAPLDDQIEPSSELVAPTVTTFLATAIDVIVAQSPSLPAAQTTEIGLPSPPRTMPSSEAQ